MTLVAILTVMVVEGGAPSVNEAPRLVREAVTTSAPSLRVELIDTRLSKLEGCSVTRAVVNEPVRHTGVAVVSLEGRDRSGQRCSGNAWVSLRAFGTGWAAARVLKEGEALAGAVSREEREVLGNEAWLGEVPEGATAAHALSRGTMLEARHLRAQGPTPGTRLTVVVVAGELRVEQQGIALGCPGRTCARLANGKRVDGELVEGKLMVTP